MKKLSTWLLVIFMIMYWILRVLVALMYEFKTDLAGITPTDPTVEIVLLFITLISIGFVAKRKLIGAIIYILTYGWYFGTTIYNGIITPGAVSSMNLFVAFLGIVLSIAVLFDMILDKGRTVNPIDKKTDWFYKNEQFDREMDERADKNNYRTM